MKNLVRLFVLTLSLTTLPAFAQMDWSAVGSVGQPDESASGMYDLNGPDLQFRAGVTGTFYARYGVTNTYGSAISPMPPWGRFLLAYIDDSNQVTIHARLMRVDKCTGVAHELCEIKSKDASTTQCDTCTFSDPIDFQRNVYYVEVDLNRTSSSGNCVIHHMGIF